MPRSFYQRPAAEVARDLLGRTLVHQAAGGVHRGKIVETEAYIGPHDLACHASKGRTARTDVMFGEAGYAYVYLVYGMYHCFNVVTDREGYPAAVLIRAVSPLEGCIGSTNGPGKLSRAMHLTRALNREDLTGDVVFIEEGTKVVERHIARGPRVGVDYAAHWAKRLLRFWIKGDPYVSRVRGAVR
ncbi:MAG: DNA-3-methyladenine glycosylase [Polyangiales bacterium]